MLLKLTRTFFETSVKEFLKNEKLTCAVLLYKDKDTYLEKVKNAALNFDVSKENSLDRKTVYNRRITKNEHVIKQVLYERN